MDLEKLKAFVVLAEELNFRRSAEILGMSQPPLTRLIAGLEKELGVKLFERSTRSVRLTGAGVVLLKEAREIQASLRRIETEVRLAGKLKSGVLRVGFTNVAFMSGFLDLVEDFKDQFPHLQIELEENTGKRILSGLKEGAYDIGVVEGVVSFPSLSSHQLSAEEVGALVPSKHALAKKTQLRLEDIIHETVILHHKKEQSQFHKLIAQTLKRLKQNPSVYIRREGESCQVLVATGKGISLTLSGTTSMAPKRTKFIPLVDLILPVRLFWNEGKALSPELQTFLSFMIEGKTVSQSSMRCLNLTTNKESVFR